MTRTWPRSAVTLRLHRSSATDPACPSVASPRSSRRPRASTPGQRGQVERAMEHSRSAARQKACSSQKMVLGTAPNPELPRRPHRSLRARDANANPYRHRQLAPGCTNGRRHRDGVTRVIRTVALRPRHTIGIASTRRTGTGGRLGPAAERSTGGKPAVKRRPPLRALLVHPKRQPDPVHRATGRLLPDVIVDTNSARRLGMNRRPIGVARIRCRNHRCHARHAGYTEPRGTFLDRLSALSRHGSGLDAAQAAVGE
jgi:hypothetical protein